MKFELRHCESEIFNIAKKYGVLSIEEFEYRYKKGEIEEEGTWDDFFKLDHLEAEKESIKNYRHRLTQINTDEKMLKPFPNISITVPKEMFVRV